MVSVLAAHAVVAILLPLLAGRLGRLVWVPAVAVTAAALAWAAAHAPEVLGGAAPTVTLPWAGTLGLAFDFRFDALALLMVFMVSGVGTVILAYSAFYYDHGIGRSAALLLAFAGAMFGLVTADHLFALYLFWELTTVLSFLLIGGAGQHPREWRSAVQALLITAAGGLAMLLGFIMLGQAAGTYRISELLADPPRGGLVPAALALVLVGSLTKSAQIPLHSWLPAAMVAPTPVSAYLHAAAMVQAGVYLVARFTPGFADVSLWRPTLVVIGLFTLVVAAWRALRETDLKGLLAYGTISELGMMMALFGAGTRVGAMAGASMMLAHALFKATLFLVVGALEGHAGSRDVTELSGVGRRLPGLLVVSVLAVASMAGLPPLIGFVGKEAAYATFLGGAAFDPWALAALVLGTVLTVAYGVRFLLGAFGDRPGRPPTEVTTPSPGLLVPAAVLAVLGLLGGTQAMLALPTATAQDYLSGRDYHLALWHGFTAPLGISALTLALGIGIAFAWPALPAWWRRAHVPDAQAGYRAAVRGIYRSAVWVTGHTQVGSLPLYLAVLLLTVLLVPGTALLAALPSLTEVPLVTSAVEMPLAVVVLVSAVAAAVVRQRIAAVLLVGAVGYGVAGLFVVRNAPDLALTQFLIETVTLVVVVLALRTLPRRLGAHREPWRARWPRFILAGAVGVFAGVFALAAAAARQEPTVALEYFPRTEETGAYNVVNAILVDFRAMDTIGEISVLLVTAIGVAALVFHAEAWTEPARSPRLPAATGTGPGTPANPDTATGPGRSTRTRAGREGALLLDMATRLLFPAVLVLSLYLLFAGHYRPGGGFAGGLVAGLAFVLRYAVSGRTDVGTGVPAEAGRVGGFGLALAATVGVIPMFFGMPPLSSVIVVFSLPLLGPVELATNLFFDMGVYLLVVGIVLKMLAAFGPWLTLGEVEEKQP